MVMAAPGGENGQCVALSFCPRIKPSVIINTKFGVVFGLSCRDPEIIGNLCRVVSLRPK